MFAAQQHFYRMDKSMESLVSYSALKVILFQIAVLMLQKRWSAAETDVPV